MSKIAKNDLGRYVRRILKQKKLTLREVERKAGGEITNSYISKILNGSVTNLTVEKIAALADGLGVEAREIFDIALVFLDIMHKVALNPQLVEILQQVIELYPAEYQVVFKYLSVLNERKRKPQQGARARRSKASN
jgi:transcriptional regulator with XRE-family HTH domain